jgi:hypothetical protein
MVCYARVIYESDESVAEMHESLETARQWIENERSASPASFRLGQIAAGKPRLQIVEIFDNEGWKRTQHGCIS